MRISRPSLQRRAQHPQQAGALNRPGETWESFEHLLRTGHEGLRRFAHRLVGDPDRADDVLQDAYLKAWRARSGFRDTGEGSHAAWLYRILYRSCLDELRRGRRRRTIALDETAEPVDPASGPETVVVARASLAAALAQLSSGARAAVLLVDVQGFDYATAASILDVPTGTVASRLSVARNSLRRTLTETDGTTGSDEHG